MRILTRPCTSPAGDVSCCSRALSNCYYILHLLDFLQRLHPTEEGVDCGSCSAIFGNTWRAILGEMMVKLVMKRRDAWGIHQPAPMNNERTWKEIYLGCYLWQLCKRRGWIVCGYSEHSRGKTIKNTRNRNPNQNSSLISIFRKNSPEMASWEDVRTYAPGLQGRRQARWVDDTWKKKKKVDQVRSL